MATLSVADRTKLWRGMMRIMSRNDESFPWTGDLTKFDLYDPSTDTGAIDAIDDWIEANQAAINQALAENFRTGASAEVKTLLFCAVAAMRISPEFARLLFGDMT